jgi:hypothetical protein
MCIGGRREREGIGYWVLGIGYWDKRGIWVRCLVSGDWGDIWR